MSLMNRVVGRCSASPVTRGELVEFSLELDGERIDRQPSLLEDGGCESLVLVEQRHQDVFDVNLLVVEPGGELLRTGDRLPGLFRESFEIHVIPLVKCD